MNSHTCGNPLQICNDFVQTGQVPYVALLSGGGGVGGVCVCNGGSRKNKGGWLDWDGVNWPVKTGRAELKSKMLP